MSSLESDLCAICNILGYLWGFLEVTYHFGKIFNQIFISELDNPPQGMFSFCVHGSLSNVLLKIILYHEVRYCIRCQMQSPHGFLLQFQKNTLKQTHLNMINAGITVAKSCALQERMQTVSQIESLKGHPGRLSNLKTIKSDKSSDIPRSCSNFTV